jgi:hypothetical protein
VRNAPAAVVIVDIEIGGKVRRGHLDPQQLVFHEARNVVSRQLCDLAGAAARRAGPELLELLQQTAMRAGKNG